MNANPDSYRKLPAYVLGARRDIWQYVEDQGGASEDGWVYFQIKTLRSALGEAHGRTYSEAHISRTLASLNSDGYIEYLPGTIGESSRARLVPSDESQGKE